MASAVRIDVAFSMGTCLDIIAVIVRPITTEINNLCFISLIV